MLVQGGILDQPANLWLARNAAGNYWQLLERTNSKSFDWTGMTESELELHGKFKEVDVDMTDLGNG